jgi:hypothetical protein
MRVPIGNGGWYLCDRSDRPDGKYTEFRGSKTLALQLTNEFRGDFFATSALRGLLGRAFPPLSDEKIAETVASRLTSGVWLARRRDLEWSPTIRERAQQPAREVPNEVRRPAVVLRSSGPAPDPPLFPDDVDAAAIAAAQKEAAALGLPFCEECLKAQLAATR